MARRFFKLLNSRATLAEVAAGLGLFAAIFLWVVPEGERVPMLRMLAWIIAGLTVVAIPCMAIVAIPYYGIPWTIYAFRLARWKRLRREGRCTYCGYALVGNISGVCPECGRKVE